METPAPRRLAPDLWHLPFPVGHVYALTLPDDGWALVDTGVPGSAPAILDALAQLGAHPADLRQIVLTHSHIDHMGSAADLVEATGARVLAGAADAPVIQGHTPELPPALTDGERPLLAQVQAGLAAAGQPPLRHVTVDTVLHDGDTLDGWGRPVHVLHVPGHTPGSIALHLPGTGTLLTGDTVGAAPGRAVLGPFNTDRAQAIASFHRMAALDGLRAVCVGHGTPLTGDATALMRQATPEKDWLHGMP
ncbi:MBL fold metallo-hydrolase [Streptomyces sp. NPDC059740]|uniref:MBL fold metallo-hydrolase n=1 Tax=Streptomyces sp. NPDC059740 TaxID=3346926 RepID=UPI003652058C